MDALTDVLESARLTTSISCVAEFEGAWSMYVRPRPEGVFYAVVRGQAWLQVKGESPLALQAGNVVFLPHGHAHTLSDHPETPALSMEEMVQQDADLSWGVIRSKQAGSTLVFCGRVVFDRSEAHPLFSVLPTFLRMTQDDPNFGARVEGLLQHITTEIESLRVGEEWLLRRLTDALWVIGLRAYIRSLEAGKGGWLGGLRDPQIARVLGRIHRLPQERWNLQSLAQQAGMSRSAFCLRFAESVCEAPFQYLTQWRMHIATLLLKEKGESIGEIALRVGYESEGAFSKAFKRMLGVSPAGYRRNLRQQAAAETTTAVYLPSLEEA